MDGTNEQYDSLRDLIREAAEGDETVFAVAEMMVGEGEDKHPRRELAVRRRQLQPEPPEAPERAESPKRAHTFHAIAGFADYLTKYGSADVVVLADVSNGRIDAVLDETAETGFETVACVPTMHPLLRPWADAAAREAMALDAFVEFLRSNRRTIREPDGRELAMTLSQVTAAIKTTIQRGTSTNSVNGIMFETKIQGETQQGAVEIPDTLTLSCPIFVGGDPVPIEVDLTLRADPGSPKIVVSVTAAEIEVRMIEAFEAMVETLRAVDGITVALGRTGHETWNYLR